MPLVAIAQALEAGLSLQQLVLDPRTAAVLPARTRDALRRAAGGDATLADALFAAGLVDDAGRAMVAGGERGGFMPAALRMVVADQQAARARRRQALLAIAYPALLVVLASVILPLPLVVSEGVSAYLARAAPGVFATFALLLGGFVVLPRLPRSARGALSGLLARLPILGAVVVDTARAATFEVLGRMLAAGVPVRQALAPALDASGLPRFRARASHAERALAAGRELSDALAEVPVVDDALASRVALAERTGTLDATLPRLATEARERAARRVLTLSALGGLLLFLLVAVGIGRALVAQTQSTFDAIDRATAE